MSNPLIRKLEVVHSFTARDCETLVELCRDIRHVGPGQDIIQQGDTPSDVHLVLDGFAYRYKILPDGNRQIVAVLVPGDFCDLHVAILGEMDHSIGALTQCTIVDIPAATIRDLAAHHPRITQALWWATLVDEGILREWLANLGQREAAQRLAHLFCELLLRLQSVGLAKAGVYDLPLRQTDLADLLGLTSVHINRSLRLLREVGLVVLERRRVVIPDVAQLKAYCGFDPSYLHLRPRQQEAA